MNTWTKNDEGKLTSWFTVGVVAPEEVRGKHTATNVDDAEAEFIVEQGHILVRKQKFQ